MPPTSRRALLASAAAFLLAPPDKATAAIIKDDLPWAPDQANPPPPAGAEGWRFFTEAEAAAVEALVDRIIPPDPDTPGGKESGCAVFLDRQLAGSYGSAEGLYRSGPFLQGTKQQGEQSPLTPAQHYRQALSALDHYCRTAFGGSGVAQLSNEQKDALLGGLEDGSIHLEGADGREFFGMLARDTKQGFFADPIHGGNRGMAAWRMIGFPGARYDQRDWVERHNQRYTLPAVGIGAHPDWTP